MSKQKKTRLSDEEALKHYTANETAPEAVNQPHLDKILKQTLAAAPELIKPDLSIDHTMAKRKTPIIKSQKRKKR